MTMSMMLGLEWGLGNLKLTLAEPSDHDFDMSEGIMKGIDCEIDVKLLPDLLIDSASMIRVVPPPWVVRFRVRSIGLLSIMIESIHLFHLEKYRHKWTIMCLVHGTSIDGTTINCKCVSSIDGPTYTERIKSLNDCIHP
jgi:hypothetical protein